MSLDDILKKARWNESDVTRLYYGGDHVCRCGCAGAYHDRGSRGFTQHMNSLAAHRVIVRDKGEIHYSPYRKEDMTCEGVDIGPNYINIPITGTEDKCICLYND